MAHLLNLPDVDMVCGLLQRFRLMERNPSLKQVKLVANTLGIRYGDFKKDKKRIVSEIEKRIGGNLKPSFEKWIDIEGRYDSINWVILLMSKMILPDDFSEHAEIKLSEDLYKHYLSLLGKEEETVRKMFFDESINVNYKHIDEEERSQLRSALVSKFSSCASKFVFKNRALSVIKGMTAEKFNAKEFCKSEVLTRGTGVNSFKIPYDSILIKECDDMVKKEITV